MSTTTTTIRTETTTTTQPMSNILDASLSTGEFKTLMLAVEKAGLTDTLRSNGPFTIFAPTDEAFKNLPVGTVDGWMRDLPKLRSILNYHIVDRKITAKEIHEMTMDGRTPSIKTLQGSPITLKTNLTVQSWMDSKHTVYANDAKIVRPEIVTGNSIIHVVDRVLLPVS
jgi:uncharacterized surface protein with fasciclin (FAS1) repeats